MSSVISMKKNCILQFHITSYFSSFLLYTSIHYNQYVIASTVTIINVLIQPFYSHPSTLTPTIPSLVRRGQTLLATPDYPKLDWAKMIVLIWVSVLTRSSIQLSKGILWHSLCLPHQVCIWTSSCLWCCMSPRVCTVTWWVGPLHLENLNVPWNWW